MKKKILCFIMIFAAAIATMFALTACGEKDNETTSETTEPVDIVAEIPYVSDFACDYYAGEGFADYAERSTAFGCEDEVLIKLSFTLSPEAFKDGKRKLTIKPILSEWFVSNIVSANTSAVNGAELTAAYDVDDRKSKNCEIELKAKFNYNGGELQIGYAYDDDEYQTTGSYLLSCGQTLKFTYDTETDGYIVSKDPNNSEWLSVVKWLNIPEIFISKPITVIGDSLFENCDNLNIVMIPDTITYIGEYAFSGCISLTSITMPDGVTSIGRGAFSGCTRLTSIAIPDKITSIGESTFYRCFSLTNIVIPYGVTSIGKWAFASCTGITSVTISDSVTEIGEEAFYNCDKLTSVAIPDSVISIGDSVLHGCSSLESIELPFIGASKTASNGYDQVFGYIFGYTISAKSITRATCQYSNDDGDYYYYIPESLTTVILDDATSIDNYVFQNCSSLTSITIPDGLASIGKHAFYGCSSLTNIPIPNSVTSIGEYAFYGCSGLTSITIPDSVTSIGEYAFYGCSNLRNVNITDIAAWCSIDFLSVTSTPLYYNEAELYLNGELIQDLIIPNTITRIGDCAFFGCGGITNVTISDSVTEIGADAFYDCRSLTSITIPDSVKEIGESAFNYCLNLTSITIPDSVTKIGEGAFGTCPSLQYYEYENAKYLGNEQNPYIVLAGVNTGVTSFDIRDETKFIYDEAFSGCSKITSITIPDNVMSIGWESFKKCSSLTSITIPDSVTSIGTWAFNGCRSLTNIAIPDSVIEIKYGIFQNCDSLKSITIPNSVTYIDHFAFYGCTGLTSIIIPDSVTSIGTAFGYNWSLKNIIFNGTKAKCREVFSTSGVYFNDDGNVTVKCSDGELKFDFSNEG